MKQFSCIDMPDDVKELFLDSYRVANGTKVIVYVEEERNLIKHWLLQNGCVEDEEVEIFYSIELSSDKFIHDEDKGEEEDGDDDDDDDSTEDVVKEKKYKKVRKVKDDFSSNEIEFDYKLLKKEKNIEFQEESIEDEI